MKLSRTLVGVIIVGSALLLAGCNQNRAIPAAETDPFAPPTDTAEILEESTGEELATLEIRNFNYAPSTLTVRPGQMVQVTNFDVEIHDVKSQDGVSFETVALGSSETGYFLAPSEPGSYEYFCTYHPEMVGTLVVEK